MHRQETRSVSLESNPHVLDASLHRTSLDNPVLLLCNMAARYPPQCCPIRMLQNVSVSYCVVRHDDKPAYLAMQGASETASLAKEKWAVPTLHSNRVRCYNYGPG